MIVEGGCSTVFNVNFTRVIITNGAPGIVVIIACRVVPGRQAATIGDNENAARSTITDRYLASADGAIHDAWRGVGVEIRLIAVGGDEASAPIARSSPNVAGGLGGIVCRIPRC